MNTPQTNQAVAEDDTECLRVQARREILAMSGHLLGDGQALPPPVIAVLDELVADRRAPGLSDLHGVHSTLSALVRPSRPRTLALLATREPSWFAAVPLTGRLTWVAMVSMVLVLAISATLAISTQAAAPLLSHSVQAVLRELLIVSTSLLGASFHGLLRVNRYIQRGTYDPKYDGSYVTQLVLGVISGVILSLVAQGPSDDAVLSLGRPLLALVGGFSAPLVRRVLERLTITVESMLAVSPRGRTRRRAEAEAGVSQPRSAALVESGDGDEL